MAAFFRQLLATLVALVIVLVGGFFLLVILVGVASVKKTVVPEHATLYLQTPVELADYPPTRGRPFGERPLTLHDFRTDLMKAAADDRIDRVVIEVGLGDQGWASLEELRQEIAKTRKAGKPVYAYVNWLTMKSEYLASACDSIWIPPNAWILFNGILAERQFHKELMDKIGVQMRVHKIEKFKAAGETDIRTDMSPEARENAQWLLDATVHYVVPRILQDRHKDQAWWDGVLAGTTMRAPDAVKLGLVDGVAYWNDLKDRWAGENKLGADDKVITGVDYANVPMAEVGLRGKTKIAVVHAQGAIAGTKSGSNLLLGSTMGSETIDRELRRVGNDKSVDAVVFRIDSPGGETFASDVIREQVARLALKKKVVVSMGDVAGSGGYMIAYCAPKLVANAMTRTGSIGSIFQFPNARGLMDKLGITFDRVTYGPNATISSYTLPWSAPMESIIVRTHWASYNEWVADVAQKRHMTFGRIDSLGRGRVWTGEQALANGLVDQVGTLDDAIALAAKEAGAAPGEKVTEVHYPKTETFWEALSSGDFDLAKEIVVATVFKDATEPLRETYETTASWLSQPELSIMDPEIAP